MSVLVARALIGFLVAPRLFCTCTFFLMTSNDCLSTESKSSCDTSTVSTLLLLLSCSKDLKKFLNVMSSGLGTDTFLGVVLSLFSAKRTIAYIIYISIVLNISLKSSVRYKNTHNGVASSKNSLNWGYEKSQQRIAYYIKEFVN